MIRSLLTTVASLAVALLCAEGVLRLAFPVPSRWIEPQTTHLVSPLLGWVLPPGTRSFTIDAPVSVNSLGLRDDELPLEKPAGERRVLCLGDSFTFGLGVRGEDLYPEQLEGRLSEAGLGPVQVVNAGVAGYNTRQELIYLLARGLALGPDAVTVAFYWNDLIGNEAPLPDLGAPMISEAEEVYEAGAREQRHLIPAVIRDRLRQSVLLYQTVTRLKLVAGMLRPPDSAWVRVQGALLKGDAALLEPHWAAAGRRLLEIAEAARSAGVPVVLMAFPDENWLTRPSAGGSYAGRLREIWSATGQPMIDLGPAYRDAARRGENPFLDYDQHPNRAGMRIAADALYEVLVGGGFLAGPPRPGEAEASRP